METIKNYLETMFANMPNTDAVHKAKEELLQMMEDKYSELIANGKSENEAVGTVISEFGNLEELSEDLGLKKEYQQEQMYSAKNSRRTFSFEEAKSFISDSQKKASMTAVGVLLCICSVIGPVITDGLQINNAIGVIALMLFIAGAIFLFVYSSIIMGKWNVIKTTPCTIEYSTANYLHQEIAKKREKFALLKTLGIVLCVVCWVPSAVISEFVDSGDFGTLDRIMEDVISPVILFIVVGVGVALIVKSSIEHGSYHTLLKANDRNTMSGHYVPEQKEEYINDTVTTIMSVYWSTVTCAYLIWSFLSFDWHITWLIWPVAAVVHSVIKLNFKKAD